MAPWDSVQSFEHLVHVFVCPQKALHVRALRPFKDAGGRNRRTGEEWLVTIADREAHIPSVSEEVVGVVDVTTLSSRQYCVILDPVGTDGKPQLGQKRVVKVRRSVCFLSEAPSVIWHHNNLLSFFQGERSFFLQPGEQLEHGIQDVYVLSEEEGLVLRAVEAFNDTEGVRACVGVESD